MNTTNIESKMAEYMHINNSSKNISFPVTDFKMQKTKVYKIAELLIN